MRNYNFEIPELLLCIVFFTRRKWTYCMVSLQIK